MTVGILRVMVLLNGVSSLKDKRKIVKSLGERLRSRFNASVAEVGCNDVWKNSVLAAACVSNSSRHVDSCMANMVEFIKSDGRIVVTDYSTEKICI